MAYLSGLLTDAHEAQGVSFRFHSIKDCWNVAGLAGMLQQRLNWCSHAKELLMDIARSEDRCTAGRVAMLVWTIWKNQNNLVWNNCKLPTRQIGINSYSM